ncbi:MAG: hypothetical protein AAGN82_08210 [Myxococcota bacterium]
MRVSVFGLLAILLLTSPGAACAPSPAAPVVDPGRWAGQTPVNPMRGEQVVYRSFGSHHPDCFVFTAGEGGETETITCPEGAIDRLEECPGGKLYAPSGAPCICVPLDGEAFEVTCPE